MSVVKPFSVFSKPWKRKSCFSNRVLVKQFLRLWNAFKCDVFEAPNLVSTKTLLLKHYCRRQLRVRTKLALSKTGRFLSKAEILGVGVFSLFQLRDSGQFTTRTESSWYSWNCLQDAVVEEGLADLRQDTRESISSLQKFVFLPPAKLIERS